MPQSPTVVFRADGNVRIGLGHVMRCLALADMLRISFNCRFAIHQPSSALNLLFQQKQVPLVALQTQDAAEFLAHIQPQDIVVLDGYLFGETFQRAVRDVCRRLVFIDDLCQGHQVADVIINHTVGVLETDYDAEPYTHFLLGSSYALVNPVFKANEPQASAQPILVNLGGADPLNVSYQIVSRLVTHHATRPVRVILGGANPHKESFASLPVSQVTVLSGVSVVDMAHEIEQCRLAIVSCSTISYEVATIGRPFIGIVTADNQSRLARFLAEQALAIGVLGVPIDVNELSRLVNQATPDQGVANQRRYLDGRAAQRFQAIFHRLAYQTN